MNSLIKSFFTTTLFLISSAFGATPMSAVEHLKKMEAHLFGASFEAKILMQVKNSMGERNLEAKVWQEGTENALVKILAPTKDKNTGNLRLKFDLWQYLPNTDRVIKIPSSLMLQSWMGSDFTNDDLVRASRLSRDYESKLLPGSLDEIKIECLPKKDAPVVWGKVVVTLRKKDSVAVSQEFYSERGELLKKMTGSDHKTFGQHTIPTLVTMESTRKGSSTTIRYQDVQFDKKIPASMFTQGQLKKPVF
jgi:outer membrane lipoprotein-sorting protein